MSSHGLPKSYTFKNTKPTPAPPVTRKQSKNLIKSANINQFLREYNSLKTNGERRTKLVKLINQNNQLIDLHIMDTELLAENNRIIIVNKRKLDKADERSRQATKSAHAATFQAHKYKQLFEQTYYRRNVFATTFVILCIFLAIMFYFFIYNM